ncbi:MAG: substrate-binding domain-containing protein [Cytophagales bacterium]|nr:substrate-binding domain-containing protein [Cytophaga sp.]
MKSQFLLLVSLILFIGFSSCESEQRNVSAVVSKDTVTVLCDPSWQPIIQSFINTYEGLNAHRVVKLIVKSEAECINDLLNKKYKTVFVSRNFTLEEQNLIQEQQRVIKNDSLCYDGLAWIVPETFPKDSATLSELKTLFSTGTLDGSSYSIQLNSTGSSVANYLTGYFGMPPSTKHIFRGGSDEEMLASIREHASSIACISSYWLVDLENVKHRAYLSSIKVLKVIRPEDHKSYLPFQDDLALNAYAFKRVLRVLNNDANSGLGTAFVSFLMSDRGQRLFLKSGLLPYKMPSREIEFKTR